MIVLAALVSVVVLGAMIGWDVVRGRTALGSLVIVRRNSSSRFWGALAFYAIGAALIFLSAAYLANIEMGCPSLTGSEPCVVVIKVP